MFAQDSNRLGLTASGATPFARGTGFLPVEALAQQKIPDCCPALSKHNAQGTGFSDSYAGRQGSNSRFQGAVSVSTGVISKVGGVSSSPKRILSDRERAYGEKSPESVNDLKIDSELTVHGSFRV